MLKQQSNLSINEEELAKQQEELKKLEQELEESKYYIIFSINQLLNFLIGKEEEGEIPGSNDNASQNGELAGAADDCDERSVFIKNVDYGADEAQLRGHFKECGEIERVTIRKDHRTS